MWNWNELTEKLFEGDQDVNLHRALVISSLEMLFPGFSLYISSIGDFTRRFRILLNMSI